MHSVFFTYKAFKSLSQSFDLVFKTACF